MSKLVKQNDVSILAHGKGAPFDYDHTPMFDASEGNQATHPLNGYWSCESYDSDGEIRGTFLYFLYVGANRTISGTRESWAGLTSVSGTVQSSSDGSPMDLELDYVLHDEHVYIKGLYDPVRDAIDAEWKSKVPVAQLASLSGSKEDTTSDSASTSRPEGEEIGPPSQAVSVQDLENRRPSPEYGQEELPDVGEESKEDPPPFEEKHGQVDLDILRVNGRDQQDVGYATDKAEQDGDGIQAPTEEHIRLHMTRTDTNVAHLRSYLSSEYPAFPRPIPSPARRRWFFAIDATKHLIRVQRMGWPYVKGKLAERRLYLDLKLRESSGLITYDDLERLMELTKHLPSSQTRLYESLTRFLLGRSYAFKT